MPDLNRSDEKLHSDRKEIAKRRHRSEVVLNYVLRLMLLGLIGWFFYCAYSFCAAYVQHTQLQRNGREAEGVIESYGYIVGIRRLILIDSITRFWWEIRLTEENQMSGRVRHGRIT